MKHKPKKYSTKELQWALPVVAAIQAAPPPNVKRFTNPQNITIDQLALVQGRLEILVRKRLPIRRIMICRRDHVLPSVTMLGVTDDCEDLAFCAQILWNEDDPGRPTSMVLASPKGQCYVLAALWMDQKEVFKLIKQMAKDKVEELWGKDN